MLFVTQHIRYCKWPRAGPIARQGASVWSSGPRLGLIIARARTLPDETSFLALGQSANAPDPCLPP